MKLLHKTISLGILLTFSCTSTETYPPNTEQITTDSTMIPSKTNRTPLSSIPEAQQYVGQHFHESTETLWITDSLQDPMGLNMAIIVDGILKAGYLPDGFEQMEGYRIYRYKKDD